MKTNFFSLLIAFFVISSVFSQSNLNDYKYVIVPNRFDFLKEADQYRLNALSKFLFEKQGFETLMDGEAYPDDLAANRCLALRSNVLKGSGMFKTKLTIELKDCNNQIVYTSGVGESRAKEYDKAYTAALRNAFKSLESLNYKYQPNERITTLAPKESIVKEKVVDEIEKLKEEIQTLKEEKETIVEAKVEAVKPKVEIEKEGDMIKETVIEGATNILYAQEIDNGFQLVDSSPKVIFKIKKTSMSNVFLVEGKQAIIYKLDANWILEYYNGDTLKTELLNIKF